MITCELKYGIYDTLTKSWLLCEFGEKGYADAQMLAAWKNDKHNGIRASNKQKVENDKPKGKAKSKPKKKIVEKEYIKRYEVRAKEAEI